MIDTNNIGSITGATVRDNDGSKIGTVEQVYLADDSGQPVWATVRTGLFGTSESFVPLESATFDGDALTVAYDKAFVKDAPRIDADGALNENEEEDLYRYYGLTSGAGYTDTTRTGTAGTVDTNVGHDTSGPTTDDAMTRSEEQLRVGTEKVQTGRARLRKFVVTEQQSVNVPVTHEEARIVREPITDANIGNATDGPDLSEEVHEVVLTEDRVVAAKETVPVERVALGTETVTETKTVTENVAHEEIEIDGNGDSRRSDKL